MVLGTVYVAVCHIDKDIEHQLFIKLECWPKILTEQNMMQSTVYMTNLTYADVITFLKTLLQLEGSKS